MLSTALGSDIDDAMSFLTKSIVEIADQNLVPVRPGDSITLGAGSGAKPKTGADKPEFCSGCKPAN